jgi:hypothetical protein
MSVSIQERPRLWLGRAALAGGALIVLFWTLYFTGTLEFGEAHGSIAQFESAFLIADAILTIALITAGIGLIRGKRYGIFCLVGSGAMTLYLGILDLTFYSRQGFYAQITPDSVVELVVNTLCILGGLAALWFGWKLWRES